MTGTDVIRLPSDGSGKRRLCRTETLSGDTVYYDVVEITSGVVGIASGLYLASGLYVVATVASGLGVLISGQMVQVASGLNVVGDFASSMSGNIVVVEGTQVSGAVQVSGTVSVTSGVYLASGLYVVSEASAQISGAVIVSGNIGVSGSVSVISGLVEIVSPASLSGLRLISGQSVLVDKSTLSGLGVVPPAGVQVSGTVAVSGGVIVSGTVVVTGVPITSGSVIVSGNVGVSGSVTVISGVIDIQVPANVYILNSGNPLLLPSDSGGVNLLSAACYSVLVKALASNSGSVYVGGSQAGQMPYSGQGFVLAPSEGVTIDVGNFGLVKVFAAISGFSRVCYMGVK